MEKELIVHKISQSRPEFQFKSALESLNFELALDLAQEHEFDVKQVYKAKLLYAKNTGK